MGKYVFARSKAIIGHEGSTVRLYENEVWAADDPVVTANPDQFSATPVSIRRSPGQAAPAVEDATFDQPVEEATSTPGVKRRTTRRD